MQRWRRITDVNMPEAENQSVCAKYGFTTLHLFESSLENKSENKLLHVNWYQYLLLKILEA